MSSDVIFVHSLFRSGSTYIFNVFRRSGKPYWCYQEPLHEAPFLMKTYPEALLRIADNVANELRHPQIDKPYYQELFEVNHAWRDTISKQAIYDQYFVSGDEDKSIPFFQSLIRTANGLPMIQECRTSSRIGSLKSALGGTHIYLWRNPWDQWWSYQLNDYFNAATQLILNAQPHPREIALFYQESGFQPFHSNSIIDEFDYFRARPLVSTTSYQAFYLLWCQALREALRSADILLNIDSLSTDHAYRANILDSLGSRGIRDIDFSDCGIPQSIYSPAGISFFHEQEDKIHELLRISGWPDAQLASLSALRQQHTPRKQLIQPGTETEKQLLEDLGKARALGRDLLHRFSLRLNEAQSRISFLEAELQTRLHKRIMRFIRRRVAAWNKPA